MREHDYYDARNANSTHSQRRPRVRPLSPRRGDWEVNERPVTVSELVSASAEGRLLEAFATGTAAVILPIESFVRASGCVRNVPAGLGPRRLLPQCHSCCLTPMFGAPAAEEKVLLCVAQRPDCHRVGKKRGGRGGRGCN